MEDIETVSADKWLGLLYHIRKRPGMYLGSANLNSLHLLVMGFDLAETMYGIPKEQRKLIDDFGWDEFEKYVAKKYNKKQLTITSFGLAQHEANGKDIHSFVLSKEYEGAWDIWWKWVDEYLESK